MASKTTCSAMLLALVLSAPAHAVNKCTGADGKVTFQDAPCPNNAAAAEVKIWKEPPGDPMAASINSAIATGKVMIGMTAQQVRSSWGSPTKINSSIGSYGKHEQWIYDRGNYRSQYVYVENGVVTAVQSPE